VPGEILYPLAPKERVLPSIVAVNFFSAMIYKCVCRSKPRLWKFKNVSKALEAIRGGHAAIPLCNVCPITSVILVAEDAVEPVLCVAVYVNDNELAL
jgi:hypothetical protein